MKAITVVDKPEPQIAVTIRKRLQFLSVFYFADEFILTEEEARKAAIVAGYDNRGTAGFYRGPSPMLATEGEYRILTVDGEAWFYENAGKYPPRFLT